MYGNSTLFAPVNTVSVSLFVPVNGSNITVPTRAYAADPVFSRGLILRLSSAEHRNFCSEPVFLYIHIYLISIIYIAQIPHLRADNTNGNL